MYIQIDSGTRSITDSAEDRDGEAKLYTDFTRDILKDSQKELNCGLNCKSCEEIFKI